VSPGFREILPGMGSRVLIAALLGENGPGNPTPGGSIRAARPDCVDSLGWRDDMNFRRYPFLPARALSALWAIGLMHGSTAAYARQQLSPLSKPSEYKDLEDMTAGSYFRTNWKPRWRYCRTDMSL